MVDIDDRVVAEVGDGLDADVGEGREPLVGEACGRGYSVAALREGIAADRLAVLLLEEVYSEIASLSAREIAAACDLEVGEVLRCCRLLGLTPVAVDDPAFDQEALGAFQALHLARESGMSDRS